MAVFDSSQTLYQRVAAGLSDSGALSSLPRLPLRHADFGERGVAEAAVLVGLVDNCDHVSLLLTERAAHLRHHAGQISFPGGRSEADDPDLVHTAIRELTEETGIPATALDILGRLPSQVTISAFEVTPIVARIAGPQSLRLDPGEVASAFEVPLAFFEEAGNRRDVPRRVRDHEFSMPEWHFAGHRIWGATAWIIDMLLKTIGNGEHR